jgi:hypothetical protein
MTTHLVVVQIEPRLLYASSSSIREPMSGAGELKQTLLRRFAAAKSHGGGANPETPQRAVETHGNWY